MSSIRKLLEERPVAEPLVVEHGGESYRLRRIAESAAIGNAMVAGEHEAATKGRHWCRVLGLTRPTVGDQSPTDAAAAQLFPLTTVRSVMMVTATLEPEEGEAPYDETEVARLAVERGALFLLLAAGAAAALGFADDGVTRVAAGNSPGTAGSAPSSTTGASKRRAKSASS